MYLAQGAIVIHIIDRKFKSIGNMKQPCNTKELAYANNRRRKISSKQIWMELLVVFLVMRGAN